MYDVAQWLSHMKYGWLAFIGIMSTSSSPSYSVSHRAPLPALVDDLTPSGSSLNFVSTHDGLHNDYDAVWIRVRNRWIPHRAGGNSPGICRRLYCPTVPVFETASEVVRYE